MSGSPFFGSFLWRDKERNQTKTKQKKKQTAGQPPANGQQSCEEPGYCQRRFDRLSANGGEGGGNTPYSTVTGAATLSFPFAAKNRSTTSSFLVRVIAGSAFSNNLPYGLSASRVSQIISTPRSVSVRISRPAPCFRLIAACGNR